MKHICLLLLMFVAAQAQLVQLHLRGTTANVQTQLNNRMRLDLSTNALTGDVTINGGGTRAFNLSGIGALSLDASTSFKLYTPGLHAASVETGYVLRLNDDSNGAAEYVPIVVDNVAALKGLPANSVPEGWVIRTLGYYSDGDGGEGVYRYWSSSTNTANNGTVIDPTYLPGRFILQSNGDINVRQFGAYGDDSHDDTAAIQSVADMLAFLYPPSTTLNNTFTNNSVFFPNGFYCISAPINWRAGANITGSSQNGAKIKTTVQTNAFVFAATNAPITIANLGFTGPSPYPTYTNVTAGAAITVNSVMNGGVNLKVKNVTIDGGFDGIAATFIEGGSIEDVFVTDIGGTALKLYGTGFSGAVNVRVKMQVYRANRAYDISNTSGVMFIASNAIGCRDWGLYAYDNAALKVSGTSFEYNRRAFCLSNNIDVSFDTYYVNVAPNTGGQVLTNGTPALIYYNERASFRHGYFVNNSTNTTINAWETAGSPNGEFAYSTYNVGTYGNGFASPTKQISGSGFNGRMSEFLEAGGGGSGNGSLTLGISSVNTGPALTFKDPGSLLTGSFVGVEYAQGGLNLAYTGATTRKAFDMTRVVTNTATSGSFTPTWMAGNMLIFPNSLTGTITVTPSSYLSAANGFKFLVYRGGGGAFNLNVVHAAGTLALTQQGQWCELTWTGSQWDLTSDNVVQVPTSISVSGASTMGSAGTSITRVRHGVATLTAGSVTVSDSTVTANSRIFLDSQSGGGTPGWLRVSARTASTSFTITSSSGTDTSTVAWMMIEP